MAITRPKQKAKWGFGGDKNRITIGDEKAVDTKDILDDGGEFDPNDGGHYNGGGDEFDEMTKKELVAYAEENDIEMDSKLKVDEMREYLREQ